MNFSQANMTLLNTTAIVIDILTESGSGSDSTSISIDNSKQYKNTSSEHSEELAIFGYFVLALLGCALLGLVIMCCFIIFADCFESCFKKSYRNRNLPHDYYNSDDSYSYSSDADSINIETFEENYYTKQMPWSPGTIVIKETSLDNIKFDFTETLQCTICLEELQMDQKLCQLPCGHVFHQDCISNWHTSTINQEKRCPLCRDNMELLEVVVNQI